MLSVNVGVANNLDNWGGRNGRMERMEKAWQKVSMHDPTVEVVFVQEMGATLGGGSDYACEHLVEATPAFEWARDGSFMCGVRSLGRYVLAHHRSLSVGLDERYESV